MQQEELIHTERQQFLDRVFDVNQLQDKDLEEISLLIAKYPFCQPLRLIAAKCAYNTEFGQKYLEEAAARVPSRKVLQDLLLNPENFTIQLVEEINVTENSADAQSISVSEAEDEKHIPFENLEIEDEIFEEITPHDDSLSFISEETIVSGPLESNVEDQVGVEDIVVPDFSESETDEIKESVIVEAPYIETLGDEYRHVDTFEETKQGELNEDDGKTLMPAAKGNDIFRYHEERLPYTFLWWLNKTRKEYQNIRPYATFRLDTARSIRKKQEEEVINHQIAENIFHLTSTDELERSVETRKTVTFDFMKKEHRIIERFLKEEPQIAPPQASKLDTENKAKKSSEDNNELVSETLAKVYVEQMLYHKALDIYKKLSLKYPEKNAYFASQIKYLELKVN